MKRFICLLGLLAIAMVAVPKDLNAKDSYVTYDQLKAFHEQQEIAKAKAAEDQWSAQLVAHAQTLVGRRTGQCVLALRNHFGISKSEVQGAAKSTRPNTQSPKVGSIIILNMSKVGHVGIVIKVDGNIITYFDSNGNWTQRGAIRTIIKGDRRIAGFRITK